jgi:hypothetical protein
MGYKKTHHGRITGHGTSGWYDDPHVVLHGEITDAADNGRPIVLRMSEADARRWAAGLIRMADSIAAKRGETAAAEPEPEQEVKPAGRLAELFGMTEGE